MPGKKKSTLTGRPVLKTKPGANPMQLQRQHCSRLERFSK
jgi:hypothetical protein